MARGHELTELEKKVLLYLRQGLASAPELFNIFKKSGQKEKNSRESMRRKLKKMEQKGYIKLQYYNTYEWFIAVITKTGVSKLLASRDIFFDVDAAWTHLPKEGNVEHDLLVAKVARKFYAEFDDVMIFYEPYLRKESETLGGKKSRKWNHFPDLRIAFLDKNNYKITKQYNAEIVLGGISRKEFFGKIMSSDYHLLVIASSEEVASFLYHQCADIFENNIIDSDKAERIHIICEKYLFSMKADDAIWVTLAYGKKLRLTDFSD